MLLPNYPAETGQKAKRLPKSLLRFVKKQDGGVTLFSLFIFLMMLLMAGMAVDLMRYETKRTALQNTIDSAVLAAANLNQDADSETLVRDFFTKSGYDGSAVVITSAEERIGEDENGEGGTLIGRTVSASLDIDMNTYFMGLLGIESLHGVSAGRATESIQGVEISMVVDISGSMGGDKIAALKTAAKNFLGIVLDDELNQSGGSKTSISLVPYNANVVVPEFLLSRLNTQGVMAVDENTPYGADVAEFPNAVTSYNREASNSRCISFDDDQMMTTDLNTNYLALREMTASTELERLAYFDEGDQSGPGDMWDRPIDDYPRFCDPTRSEILVHETRKSVIETAIDGLSAGGWTAVDQGMKWGVSLLDPGMRPVINDLVTASVLQEDVRNRPGDYIGTETMKVVVLMTDGANTVTKDVKSEYKRGPSPVWFSPSTAGALFSENDDGYPNYFNGFFIQVGPLRSYQDDANYWYQPQILNDRSDGAYFAKNNVPADAYQLTWSALFDRFAVNTVPWLFRDSTWKQER